MEIPIDVLSIVVGVERVVETLRDDHPIRNLLLARDDIFQEDTPKAIREVDAYIGELFTKSANDIENLYWFTSAIARVYLKYLRYPDTSQSMDGFVYPSVESQFSGVNIALKESFTQEHLRVLGANWYEVEEYDANRSYYKMQIRGALGNRKTDHSTVWKKIHPKHGILYYELSPDTQTLPFVGGELSLEDDE